MSKWTKIYDRSFHFAYSKNDGTTIIAEEMLSSKMWVLEIRKKGRINYQKVFEKVFTNKSEALHFAKSYMRRN